MPMQEHKVDCKSSWKKENLKPSRMEKYVKIGRDIYVCDKKQDVVHIGYLTKVAYLNHGSYGQPKNILKNVGFKMIRE